MLSFTWQTNQLSLKAHRHSVKTTLAEIGREFHTTKTVVSSVHEYNRFEQVPYGARISIMILMSYQTMI